MKARKYNAGNFIIKDSGKRARFKGGMVRDVADDKLDPSLVRDGPMYLRWVIHLTNGAIKYFKRNWMKASGEEELARFKESALRHFDQWFAGEVDEDHAAALFFNVNGYEFVKAKLATRPKRKASKRWKKGWKL